MTTLLLFACTVQKSTSPQGDTNQTMTDSAGLDSAVEPPTVLPEDATFFDLGLCQPLGFRDNTSVGPFTGVEEPSPFGVGDQTNVILGPVTRPDLFEYAPQAGSVDYTIDLGDTKFDLYVPEGYDGSEPYGLVGFINSGNNGGAKEAWKPILDQQKIIWIGAQDAGNAVNVDVRMGKTILGMWRMLELYNIDRSRFYATGNSGGARTAQVMSWLHPRSIQGAFPLCGGSYFREVTQEFETHEPEANYEFWGTYYYPAIGNEPFAEWIVSYPRPMALLTSKDDFRQGDLLNIYHHGFQQDHLPVRYLEVGGNHCATDSIQVESAIGFMDHPFFTIVEDTFSSGAPEQPVGTGWADASGDGARSVENNGLILEPNEQEPAVVVFKDFFHWDDLFGLLLNTNVLPSSSNTTISLWAADPNIEISDLRNGQLNAHPGIHVDITETALYVFATGIGGTLVPIFQGSYTSSGQPLEINAQIWSTGFQLDIGNKLTPSGNNPANLGPDEELLHMRWSELPNSWNEGSWSVEAGSVLTLVTRGSDPATIQDITIKDGLGIVCE